MADMIVLTAAVLGVNLGIFAALYWQKARARQCDRARDERQSVKRWVDTTPGSKLVYRPRTWPEEIILRMHGFRPETLTDRLRWYTLH